MIFVILSDLLILKRTNFSFVIISRKVSSYYDNLFRILNIIRVNLHMDIMDLDKNGERVRSLKDA